MVRERKAFSTDTVQTILPDKNLEVTNVPVQDFGPSIETRLSGSGIELVPSILKTASTVTKAVSDVVRNKRSADNYVQRGWDAKMVALDDKEQHFMLQQQQQNKAFETSLEWDLEAEQARYEAFTSGEADITTPVMSLLAQKRKQVDSTYSTSPYYAAQLSDRLAKLESHYLNQTVKDTYAITENKAKYNMEYMASYFNSRNGTKYGVGADAVIGNFYDTLESVGPMVTSHIPTPQLDEHLNKTYNNITIKSKILEVQRAVSSGALSVKEGRSILLDIADNASHVVFEYVDGDGKKRKSNLYITPEMNKELRVAAGSLSDGGASSRAFSMAKMFADPFRKEDKVNISNVLGVPSLEEHNTKYKNIIQVLQDKADNGEAKALAEAGKVTYENYTLVDPSISASFMLRAAANKGELQSVLNQFEKDVIALERKALSGKYTAGELRLVYTKAGLGSKFVFGFPGESDRYLKIHSEEIGTTPELLLRNGTLEMCSNLKEIIKYARENEEVFKNPELSQEAQRVSQLPLTRATENGYQKDIAVDPDLDAFLNDVKDEIIKTPEKPNDRLYSYIEGKATAAQQYPHMQYLAEQRVLADKLYKSGLSSQMILIGNIPMNSQKHVRSFYEGVQAQLLLLNAGSRYSGLAGETYRSGKKIEGVADLVNLIKSNRNESGITEEAMRSWLSEVYNDKNIPDEDRYILNIAISQALAGLLLEGNQTVDANTVKKVASTITDATYTDRGTSKIMHPEGDLFDKKLDAQNAKWSKRAKLVGGKDITAEATNRSDAIEIKQMDYDLGYPTVVTFSRADEINVPLQVYSSTTGGDRATDTLVLTGGIIASTVDAHVDPIIFKANKKKGLNLQVLDINNTSLALANSFMDKETQESFRKWEASGYTTEQLTSVAPFEFKRLVLEKGKKGGWSDEESKRIERAIDYFYAKGKGATIPISLDDESVGVFRNDVTTALLPAAKYGVTITGRTEAEGHVEGSLHPLGRAIDVGGESHLGGFYGVFVTSRDNETNHLKKEVFDSIGNPIEAMVKLGIITKVIHNRPELTAGIDARSKDKDFEKYRNMKNIHGQPVFVYDSKGGHLDHFHIEFAQKEFDLNTGEEISEKEGSYLNRAIPVIRSNVSASGLYSIDDTEARAAVLLGSRYKVTEEDAKRMGWSSAEVANAHPLARSTAFAMKYAEFFKILGDKKLAAQAMAGAVFKMGSDEAYIIKYAIDKIQPMPFVGAKVSTEKKTRLITPQEILKNPKEIREFLKQKGSFIVMNPVMSPKDRGKIELFTSTFWNKGK